MKVKIKAPKISTQFKVERVYPGLEDLEVKPSGIEQNFKSSKYGFDNVKVREVTSDNLEITPTLEEQEYVGLYGTVNVNPATEVYNNAYEEGYDTGYTEGFNSAPPDYLPYVVNTPSWQNVQFPEDLRDVILNLDSVTYLTGFRFFGQTNATSVKIVGKNITRYDLYFSFQNSPNLKIIDLSQCGDGIILSDRFAYCFQLCGSLESIICNLDFSKTPDINYTFENCSALKEIRVVPLSIKAHMQIKHSLNLSSETIESIINGLATVETTQTLTLHNDVKAKLTDEQIATITSKNWNLA